MRLIPEPVRTPIWSLLAVLILVSPCVADECDGQGNGILIIKGSCEVGTDLKFKLAGPPKGFYRLWLDFGSGPVTVPEVGTFCLDFSEERQVISSGYLNHLGFRSGWWTIPDDPEYLGRTLAFQFAAVDPVTDDVVISNSYAFDACGDGGPGCDEGIRRLGYFTVLRGEFAYPVMITSAAFWTQHPEEVVGEVSFEFDPDDPPTFPIVSDDEDLAVTKVEVFHDVVVVHAIARGCEFANGRLPNNTTFETTVGDLTVARDIHTSCSLPISAGSNFNPVFVTMLQDVKSAPEGDCE